MAILILGVVVFLLFLFANKVNKPIPLKRAERQKQTDELIAVVLPTINTKN